MPKPTGTVYLCANAIIDNSYSNTIDFKTPSEQYSYWGSLVKYTITDFMYIRRTQAYIKVNKNLTELDDINYLFFRAEEDSKLYYCFVTSKEYISDNASYIYIDTDVLQSYMFDYSVKESYVLQEHCDRWTADHQPIFSRTDEGLECGSEYTVESAYNILHDGYQLNSWYLAIVTPGMPSKAGHELKKATEMNKIANPYLFLLLPSVLTYDVIVKNPDRNIDTPVQIVPGTVQEFQSILESSELGAYVQQIIRLPYLPFKWLINDTLIDTTSDKSDFTYATLDFAGVGVNFIVIDSIDYWSDVTAGNVTANKEYFRKLASMPIFDGLESAMPTAEQWAEIKANPYNTQRDKRFESKLLTHPYRYNLLTDWKNQPAIIKNEYINSNKIQVNFTQGISFNGPARYWVDDYRKDPEGRYNSITQSAQEDVAIIRDEYYQYMLQNRNQLQADRSNAKATMDSNIMLAGVNGLISTAMGIGNSTSILGAAHSVVGSAGSTLSGMLNAKVQGELNYNNLIRSQNAKQSDLKNFPDSIISSNDSSFNIQDDNRHLSFYRMKICCEFEELIADTFATSGYTVKRVKLPNLKTRVRYNYVKTIGANIVGSFNQDDLRKIRAIFDNGVTFWHYNTVNFKPYDYSLENIETTLL